MIPDPCPALAILDWGIGGLGFFRLLREQRPRVPITYLSDSGEIAYGKLGSRQLTERLQVIVPFLQKHGVTRLVVACNAMSTVLPLAENRDPRSFPMIGVISPTIDFVRTTDLRRIGIVGGRRTILSGSYRRPLTASGKIISQRIAQPLSALIETGRVKTPGFARTLHKIAAPLRKADALVLGCTHYSAAVDLFQRVLPDAKIIDPASLTLSWVLKHWRLPPASGPDVFITTGSAEEMKRSARIAFGVHLPAVLAVDKKLAT
jgi:glutamate racemase